MTGTADPRGGGPENLRKDRQEGGCGGEPNKANRIERLRQIARDVYGCWLEEEKPKPRKGLSAETVVETRCNILGIPDQQSLPTTNWAMPD